MPRDAEIAILAPGAVSEAQLPRRWKRRGTRNDLAGMNDTRILARAFGLAELDIADAPLHYLGVTGSEPGGYCLYAFPVHLHARREQLILMSGREFAPSESEADELAALIGEHFPEWRIERTDDDMWFIVVDDEPQLETTPLQAVLGEDINDHLPRGRDGMKWTSHLNEIQMILFESAVNERREAEGAPPVNSLWFWGGGRLPDIPAPPWRRVVTNDPVARGIALRAGIETHWLDAPPAAARRGDTPAISSGGTLWVHAGTPPGDSGGPLSGAQWAALRDALKRGTVARLVLIDPGQGELVVDAGRLGGWWPW